MLKLETRILTSQHIEASSKSPRYAVLVVREEGVIRENVSKKSERWQHKMLGGCYVIASSCACVLCRLLIGLHLSDFLSYLPETKFQYIQ